MAKFQCEYDQSSAFGFDSSKIVHTFSASSNEWVATEDCYICGWLYYTASMGNTNAYVTINGVQVALAFIKIGSTFYDAISAFCAPIRKGQRVVINSNNYSLIKCYGK